MEARRGSVLPNLCCIAAIAAGRGSCSWLFRRCAKNQHFHMPTPSDKEANSLVFLARAVSIPRRPLHPRSDLASFFSANVFLELSLTTHARILTSTNNRRQHLHAQWHLQECFRQRPRMSPQYETLAAAGERTTRPTARASSHERGASLNPPPFRHRPSRLMVIQAKELMASSMVAQRSAEAPRPSSLLMALCQCARSGTRVWPLGPQKATTILS
jgi:hypothetical protein